VESPYDYFHINAVNLDSDGNLLISGRHTWTVYKIDRATGAMLWRLGGKSSDFTLGPGAQFAWQHDPLPAGDGTIRLFDNEGNGSTRVLSHSRVIWLHLDSGVKTATLIKEIPHPLGLSAASQGNAQGLDNGNTFVGWGALAREELVGHTRLQSQQSAACGFRRMRSQNGTHIESEHRSLDLLRRAAHLAEPPH